jgi:membrane protease YdiL (CAAX protease family)
MNLLMSPTQEFLMTASFTAPALHPRDLPDSEQYSLGRILAIWAASAAPMGLSLWWITPTVLVSHMEVPGTGYLVLATLGLVWQSVLALVRALPSLEAPEFGLIENLAVPEVVGQWWLMGVRAALIVDNYLVGEELIFRGILLPKTRGVFGRWRVPVMLVTDWV